MDKKISFKADGMTCTSCEKIIAKTAKKIDGVKNINIDYATQKGTITFDDKKTDEEEIFERIEEKGYSCCLLYDNGAKNAEKENKKSLFDYLNPIVWSVVILLGIYLIVSTFNLELPTLGMNVSYGLLFLIGLLTGFHCIGMCGGFVLSYTARNAAKGKIGYTQHVAYGSGKLISYTVIGAIFGIIGSIFIFSNTLRSLIAIVAGLFLIIYGLNMLNIIPFLRKISLRLPNLNLVNNDKGPLTIGLLNGLFIACGPLQAMYIYAMGTGSAIQGGLSLMFFGLGTTIPLLGFGIFAGAISGSLTRKILKLSGIIIIILGIVMLNRGLALSGSGYDYNSLKTKLIESSNINNNNNPTNSATAKSQGIKMENGYQIIEMDVTSAGWSPDKFVLKTGVPVKWRINAIQITNCNKAIQVPAYNLKFDLKPGIQEIEFTPTKAGVIPWSCWMGMIPGTFIVKDDVSDAAANQQAIASTPVKASGGSCGMGGSGGGCGCGG